MHLTCKKRIRRVFSLEMAKLCAWLSAASCVKSRRVVLSMTHRLTWPYSLDDGAMSRLENIASLMNGWMTVVGLYHLLGRAVEKPIDRALGRHRLSSLLHERLLDGCGPTVCAMLGQRLAQGHDDLGEALGRCGRGGAGASAPCGAPRGSRCQGAIPPCVEPTFRAGPFSTDVL